MTALVDHPGGVAPPNGGGQPPEGEQRESPLGRTGGWAASARQVRLAEERVIEIVGAENMAPFNCQEKKLAEKPIRVVHRRHKLFLRK
jgi:hypothetical protein